MEDYFVFGTEGLFFLSIPLRILKQSIGNSICLALTVIDLEVVMRKFLSLADLSETQTFCIHKSTKVVVVNKDKDLMFVIFWIVLLGFKCLNNG